MNEDVTNLIGVDELAALLDGRGDHGGTRVALLDVRWALGDPHGLTHYLDGHLPGAVFVDLDHELSGEPSPTAGRHPLPESGQFHDAVLRWGVNDGQRVVVYDDAGGLAAARAWWLLRHAGLTDVRLLDGGLAAWTGSGRDLERGQHTEPPGDVRLTWGAMPVTDLPDVATAGRHGVLLDARAAERYRGDTEPIDSRAGHIPGAVSAPTAGNLTAAGTFLPAADLRARFTGLGVEPDMATTVYCGSGVTAAHEVLALAEAGFTATLYPGSWSQYAATDLDAATGDAPG